MLQNNISTKISLVRSDSQGIKGTYANAEHHAEACLPLIKALEAQVSVFGFKEWRQGHNVHLFETKDGRKFDIIPYFDGNEYLGLQLRARLSRSSAVPLQIITTLAEVNDMITTLKFLARPMPQNKRGKFQHERH